MSISGCTRRALCAFLPALLALPLAPAAQPAEFAALIKAGLAKYERVVRFSGAKVD